MKKKKNNVESMIKRKDAIILCMLILVVIVSISSTDIFLHDRLVHVIDKTVLGMKAGEIADKDVVAEEAVYYIDIQKTKMLQDEAIAKIYPVFRVSLTKSLNALEKLDALKTILLDEDSSREEKVTALQEQGLDKLFIGNQLQTIISYSNEQLTYLFLFIEELLIQSFEKGIYEPQELAAAGTPDVIELIKIQTDKSIQETVSVDDLLTMDTLNAFLQETIDNNNEMLAAFKDTVIQTVSALAVENVMYDSITTERRREEARQSVRPVVNSIEKGELIIKEGFVITQDEIEKLRALEQVEVDQSYLEIIGRVLFYTLFSISLSLIILRVIPKTQRKTQYLYIIVSSVFLYTLLYVLLINQLYARNITHVAFFSPILLFSMLLTIIIDREVSLCITGFVAITSLFIPEITLIEAVYILAVGVSGSLTLHKARRRIDLIRSAAMVAFLSMIFSCGVGLVLNLEIDELYRYAVSAGIVGILSGIIVVFILPVLENLFNLPTDFRLIELTTMNSKTLKRMAVMARGTYSHSVAVADLSESACEAIGANHLLARVGAYYHDIGKIDQPEYFIENQNGDNKHDELKPSLSAVVIKSHVKVGIEKAKEIGLPQEVIDILAQHHGSDVISYFYREALINNEKGSKISPEDFSYNGTPPMTKEAAVVMLADSVDAVSRTLKQPTTTKLDKIIWKIIMEKIEHKQLIYCDLSLKELEIIKNSFIMILTGRFHTRIEYPEAREGKNS